VRDDRLDPLCGARTSTTVSAAGGVSDPMHRTEPRIAYIARSLWLIALA
jgi:hypothetical protein